MKIGVILIILIFALLTNAEVINVPEDHETIQRAIDASEDGDSIFVDEGEYFENINFNGKAIAVIGNPDDPNDVIINGGGEHTGATFHSQEGNDSILRGFIIINCVRTQRFGSGISCYNGSSPTLSDLIISNNIDGDGIGTLLDCNPILENIIVEDNNGPGIHHEVNSDGFVRISNCIIRNNEGTGLICTGARVQMDHTLISGNIGENAGGVYLGASIGNVFNNVSIILNRATVEDQDGGINFSIFERGSTNTLVMVSSIVFDNIPTQVGLRRHLQGGNPSTLRVEYCDIEGGREDIEVRFGNRVEWVEGNIDEDPLFVDPDEGDYHLTEDSPCIDAGDPNGPEDPDGTRADMGAYYFHQRIPDEDGILHVPDEYETIQGAIDASEDGDSIFVDEGEYFENINFNGKAIVITGRPNGHHDVIINGDSSGTVVTFNNDEAETSQLIGLTIANGFSEGNGGGINCEDSNPTFIDLWIRDNYAQVRGGGISCEPNSSPDIINCTVTRNEAGSGGGGIWCGDNSNPEIYGSSINRNSAVWNGGGINMYIDCNPVILQSNIYQNSAGLNGGGLIVSEGCSPVITQSFFTENRSTNSGGGIAVERGADVSLTGCLILDNNSDGAGDGIAALENSSMRLINCIIAWEPEDYLYYPLFCSASDVDMVNSIIYGFSALEISFDPDSGASSLDIAYCNIGGRDSVALDPNGNGQIEFIAGTISADPRFLSPVEGDYSLREDSPCIDAGTAFFVWEEDTLVDISENEYRGNAPDMGVFESWYNNDIDLLSPNVPSEFNISSIYPNPFNSSTTIHFSLPIQQKITVNIFDISGRLIETIYDDFKQEGHQSIAWNADNIGSGIYFVQIQTDKEIKTAKLIVIK